jgi:hypothetical protein
VRRAALAAVAILAAAEAAAEGWSAEEPGRMANGTVEYSARLDSAAASPEKGYLLAVCLARGPWRTAALALGTEEVVEGRVAVRIRLDGGAAEPTPDWAGPHVQVAYLHGEAALAVMRAMERAGTMTLTATQEGGPPMDYVFEVGNNRAALAAIVARCRR